jgi:hypothetical protein
MCPHVSQARVELQQCWQKLNHLARAQVVALIELLENRMNAMGQGGTLLAMMKQKTMSKIVRPKKMPPFDNVAGQMRKMSAQLKVMATPAVDLRAHAVPRPRLSGLAVVAAGCELLGAPPRAAGGRGQRIRYSFPILRDCICCGPIC